MRLKYEILQKINTPKIRVALAQRLGVTEASIINYIKRNSDNLTKAAALQIIREALRLSDEQLLEEDLQAA